MNDIEKLKVKNYDLMIQRNMLMRQLQQLEQIINQNILRIRKLEEETQTKEKPEAKKTKKPEEQPRGKPVKKE